MLLTPNGAASDTFNVLCVVPITWTPSTFFSNVDLFYSTNNGVSWTTINTNLTNNGTYNWTIPNNITPSTQCLIKAANTSDNTVFDVSDNVFTIFPGITVNTPNGGESWVGGCTQYVINWKRSPCIGNVNIKYSTNGGTSWSNVVNNIANTGTVTTTQSYTWTTPQITSTQTRIKVEASSYTATINDMSNSNFTITPIVQDITVTAPNGGEVITGGSTYVVTWTVQPSSSGFYNVQWWNGSTWTNLVTNTTATSYTWNVPNAAPTKPNCLISVTDAVQNCKTDQSNAVFTVTYVPPTPVLLTPNGGESMYAGTTFNITWNTSTFYSTIDLWYSVNNGTSWTMITNSETNDGTYIWTVPNANSTSCLVKAANTADNTVYDVSNAVFTIKPAVTILTPNGDNGSTLWGGCTVTSITFDRSPAWSSYTIQYSLNNGSTWTNITTAFTSTLNPATYNWNIGNIYSSQTLVKVIPNLATPNFDVSDATFTITKPVTIIQPNFGGIMQVGSQYTILWSSDGISNLYDIFYSINGGASFTNIVTAYNTSTNTYTWTVPNNPSTACRILVRDNINTCKSDTSDLNFTISGTAPPITLTSPNGNSDTLSGCTTKTITWTEPAPAGVYDLHYSLNAGVTWTAIALGYATGTGTYNWVVPNTINSNSVLLRVRSSSNPSTVFDLSDAYFTIRNGAIAVSPTSTVVCSGASVQLNASGSSGYTWTPASGLSATNISNPVATPTINTTYTVQTNTGCVLTNTVAITVTTGTVPASVNVSANPGTTICSGSTVTFSATPTNGGTGPTYQWQLNGGNVGTNSATYTTSTIATNDQVTCIMTSNLGCVTGSPSTSNTLTMTVSPNVAPSVTVSSTPSGTICAGTSVTFSASVMNGGGSPSYQWQLNGANVGTNSSTYTNSSLANGNTVRVILTSNASCLSATTATSTAVTMTVVGTPATPGVIFGNTAPCLATASTFSVAPVMLATSYNWTLPGGWAGTSTTNTISGTPGSSGVISVTATGACGTSAAQTKTVTVNTVPTQPGTIAGNTVICVNSTNTYSIATVANTTSYTWTKPGGWTGTSTTNTLSTTAVGTSGTLSVTANNACGSSTVQTLSITVNPTPVAPGAISGPSPVCVNSINTYSVAPVAGALSYGWTFPGGWTGTSTTNTVAPTAGSSGTMSVVATNACGNSPVTTLSVTVNPTPTIPGVIFGTATVCAGSTNTYSISAVSGATSYSWYLPGGWGGTSTTTSISTTAGSTGSLSVTANNACGAGPMQTKTVTVNPLPAQPGAIAGNTNVCPSSTNTYSVSPVAGATSYTWTKPGGWTGTSTTNTLSATAGSSGTFSVTANNACGASTVQTLSVTVGNTLSAPGSISGNTAVCSGSANTYSVAPVSGATSYAWTLPGGWSGTSTTNTINTTAGGSGGPMSVTASNSCATSTAQTLSVAVTNTLSAPGSIDGSINVCAATVNTYSVAPVSGATSYAWTLPGGWSGTSTTNTISATAGSSGTMSVTAGNSCATSPAQTLSVTVGNSLGTPGSISGNTAVCSGSANTYSVAPVSGATSYAWTLPGGWSGTSATNTISATAGSSGTMSITASNSCATSAAQILAVTVNTTPAAPGSISGNATICSGSSNTYSVAVVGGATSYAWTLPGGWSGTSSTNTISTTAGSSGSVSVTASNSCGTSSAQTVSITVNTIPSAPGTISGNATICSGSNNSYSVSSVSGATSYNWSLPGGWSGTSATNTISATAGSSGTMSITASNSCGTSSAQTLSVTVNTTPATPGTISGNATICLGSSNIYSISSVSGATSYNWYLPSGWSGSSSTNSIGTTAGSSGSLSVTATNACGTSSEQTLAITVNTTPAAPGTISGNTTICSGSTNTYSVASVSGATSYGWMLPGGWSGTSSTNTISTTAGSSGTITVTPINSCGTSSDQTLSVTVNAVPATPGTISGSATICSGSSNTYSISSVSGATSYNWSLPGGWSGTSTTNTISTTAGSSGTLTITAANSCGTSAGQTLAVTVNTTPATPGSIAGNAVACVGSTQTYSVANDPNVTLYTWSLPGGWTGTSTSNTISITAGVSGGSITVTGGNGCGTSAAQNLAVTTNDIPATPGTISGTTTLCSGTADTYSVTNDPSATSYAWTLPGGWFGTSTTNTISATVGTSGNITVVAVNACGSSTQQTLVITVNAAPSTPAAIDGNAAICGGVAQTYSVSNDPNATSYTWSLPGGWSGSSTSNSINTTDGGSGGVISVTATNGCGTSSAQTLNVTVNTAPATPGSIAGNTTLCEASAQSYSVANDPNIVTYNWSLPAGWSGSSTSGSISAGAGASGGVISVTGTNGCGTSAAQSITVTVNALPSVSISASANTLCVNNNPVSLTGSPSGGTFSGTGVIGSTFDPAVSGVGSFVVTYLYTDLNSCSNSDSTTIVVNGCTAMNVAGEWQVGVYPNPFNNSLEVQIPAVFGKEATLNLFSTSGQLVMTQKVASGSVKLNVKDLPFGMYYLQVKTETLTVTKKIIKE